jgi:hypothetical protein
LTFGWNPIERAPHEVEQIQEAEIVPIDTSVHDEFKTLEERQDALRKEADEENTEAMNKAIELFKNQN